MKKKVFCSLLGIVAYGFSSTPVLNTVYELNETAGVIANDSSSSANHGNLFNGPVWTQDDSCSFLNFDKSLKQYIDCGTAIALSGNIDFSVSAWIKTTSAGTIIQQRCKGRPGVNGYNGEYILKVTGAGKPHFMIYNGGYQFGFAADAIVTDDQWHLITAIREGENGFIYVDGELKGQKTGPCKALDDRLIVYIGGDQRDSVNYFSGGIDDVKIFKSALTAKEVEFLAQNRGILISGDEDGDSLSNIDEYTLGTNIFESDPDGDGFTDAEELANNTDPNLHNGGAPAGWMFASIGNTTEDSTISYDEDAESISLQVKSGDVWNKVDNFGYAYKTISGDFSATVKVDSVTGKSYWTKASLMLRNVAESSSAFASAIVSSGMGIALQGREDENNWCSHKGATGLKAPYWLRLIRKANLVTAYVSHDGKYWAELGTKTVNLEDEVKIGLGLCANNLTNFANAMFSEFELQALDDLDADGLSDVEERMLLTDLTSDDTDVDQNSDLNELTAENSPLVPPTEIDGKIYHKSGLIAKFYFGYFKDLPDFSSLPINEVLIRKTASFDLGWDEVTKLIGQNITAMTLESMLYVPEDGEYTFYTNSDDGSRLLIDGNSLVENGGAHGMQKRSATVTLTAGLHKFELQYFQQGGAAGLWTSWSGPAFEEQIIPRGNFVYSSEDFSATFALKDQDSDGLTDIFEDEIGSDKTKADSNGDGLTDKEKYDLGLDIMSEDTDEDGISDLVEITESLTDPVAVDFDGTITEIQTITGNQITNSQGTWEEEGSTIVAKRARGFVEYEVTVPESDCYNLSIAATHQWLKYSCSPVSPIDNSDLMFYIDGDYVGKKNLVAPDGIYGTVSFFTPYLTPGTHTVKIFWENVHSRISLQIKDIQVSSFGGPDADNSGVKDWVETYLGKSFSLDAVPASSYVSPVCLEGNAQFVNAIKINDSLSATQGAGDRWFANLDLNQDGPTAVNVAGQNGGLTKTATTSWVGFNLLNNIEQELTIRVGDSVKFTVNDDTLTAENSATITVGSVVNNLTVGTDFIQKFDIVGEFTVDASANALTGSVKVKVIAVPQTIETPACMVGKRRAVTIPGLTADMIVESDETVVLERDETNPEKIYVTANKTNKPHSLVVRGTENGPVIYNQELAPFWIQAAVDSYFWVVERYDDYEVWENSLIAKNIPANVEIKIAAFIAGVTLEDGSLANWITPADLNELGEYTFRLNHPNSLSHSACHTIKAYQVDADGTKRMIGEAYYSGNLVPDDE